LKGKEMRRFHLTCSPPHYMQIYFRGGERFGFDPVAKELFSVSLFLALYIGY